MPGKKSWSLGTPAKTHCPDGLLGSIFWCYLGQPTYVYREIYFLLPITDLVYPIDDKKPQYMLQHIIFIISAIFSQCAIHTSLRREKVHKNQKGTWSLSKKDQKVTPWHCDTVDIDRRVPPPLFNCYFSCTNDIFAIILNQGLVKGSVSSTVINYCNII